MSEEKALYEKEGVAPRDLVTWLANQRKITAEQALLQLAENADLITRASRESLLRKLGELIPKELADPARPEFDVSSGQLYFKDEPIGKIPVRKPSTAAFRILEAFQRQDWPTAIKDLGRDVVGSSDIHTVVCRLNKQISRIRFHVQDSGHEIYWKVSDV